LAHVQQDYNDKIIEAQTRRGERHRRHKNSQLNITQTQEMMLREIVETAQAKGRYTSLVNHGDARKAVETLEKKGLVKLILSPDKVVPTDYRSQKNAPRPLIENVVPTDAGHKYILDIEEER